MYAIGTLKMRNAISIKFNNILDTPAIKVILLISLILSMAMSFFPYLQHQFMDVNISVGTDLDISELVDDTISVYGSDAQNLDILIRQDGDEYVIQVLTQKGYGAYSGMLEIVSMLNYKALMSDGDVSKGVLRRLAGQNVTVEFSDDINDMDDSVASFLMMITFIFFLVMTLLITRIGVQVAFEKGNKITETILTSITREQLYISHVLSSFMVNCLSFIVVSIPMIIAYGMDDPAVATDFSFFSGSGIFLFLFHLIIVSASLVTIGIAIGSMVKQAEDANTMTFLVMMPVMVSYIYYIMTLDRFRGIWTIMNYVPVFSIFPVFGGLLQGNYSQSEIIVLMMIDCIFYGVVYGVSKRIYCKYV